MAEPWTDMKIEVEKGRFFLFGGPYEARELWEHVLLTLDCYHKPFPLSMKVSKGGNLDQSVTILPREDGAVPHVLAVPAFHLWCGVPQAVVEAQKVAEQHQVEEYIRSQRKSRGS